METIRSSEMTQNEICFIKIRREFEKDKAIHVTGRGGLEGCAKSKIPHCLDKKLTDSSDVTALRSGRALPAKKIHDTHFY
jgi:hypothetical protein